MLNDVTPMILEGLPSPSELKDNPDRYREILVSILLKLIETQDIPVWTIQTLIDWHNAQMHGSRSTDDRNAITHRLLSCFRLLEPHVSQPKHLQPLTTYLNHYGYRFTGWKSKDDIRAWDHLSLSMDDTDLMAYNSRVVSAIEEKLVKSTSLVTINEDTLKNLLCPALLTITAKQLEDAPEATFYFHTLLSALQWEAAVIQNDALSSAIKGGPHADPRLVNMVKTDGFQHLMSWIGKAEGDWTDLRTVSDPFKGLLTSLVCNIPYIA